MIKETWRTKMVLALPWVTRVRQPGRCNGLRYSKMPLYALKLTRDEQYARWGCKHAGAFKFKALGPTKDPWNHTATSGVYCWSHLLSLGIQGTMREDARTTRWWKKHGYIAEDGAATEHARNA